MTLAAATDIFARGGEALALARAAFGGRGFFTPVRRRLTDGSWLGPEDAVALDTRNLIQVRFTFGEPEDDRRERLAALAIRLKPEAWSLKSPPCAGANSLQAAVVVEGIVPTPTGEPQGLDTLVFFAACRVACPGAHLVVDLERFGHKLGQLCLSFGADEIMGSIVDRRELRLGVRAGSKELTRDEAKQLLCAAGFTPCERLPDGGACPP
jgi:hypothetical protein